MFKGFEVEDKQLHEMSSGGNQEKTAPQSTAVSSDRATSKEAFCGWCDPSHTGFSV